MDLQKFVETSGVVARARTTIKNRLDDAQSDLEIMRSHEIEFDLMASALAGLRTSCLVPDPRPRGFAQWFFVRSFMLHEPWGYPRVASCDRFWIKDILDDPETAEKTLAPKLLGITDEVTKSVCARFGKPNPNALVVGKCECTVANHLGEEWELKLFTLCLSCPALTLICRHVDNYEFAFV